MARSQGSDKKHHLVEIDHYPGLHAGFRWQVPERFNMAEVCSRRWAADPATASQTAVIACSPDREDRYHGYAELQAQANRLSNALQALGVQRGDRVAIVLPQRFETAVAYMAVLQLGAVGMPDPQRVFEKYYRGPNAHQYSGSGLGLYWVRGLAQMLGGDVICSVLGGDVTFTLVLPILAVSDRGSTYPPPGGDKG